jgi:hypothetical protein
MTAKNDITGDLIKSKINSKEFSENFDRIFGVKQEPPKEQVKQESGNDVRSKRRL